MPWLMDLLQVIGLAEVGTKALEEHRATQIEELILLKVPSCVRLLWLEIIRSNPV